MNQSVLSTDSRFLNHLKTHDIHTFQHSVSVSVLLERFGGFLGMSTNEVKTLKRIGLLHDIGKLEISPDLLNKPAKLTEKEWLLIKAHPLLGSAMLKKENYESSIQISILEHHENFDGTGYPYERRGEDISLFGRMIRIVDSFDAMTSIRSYGKKLNTEDALTQIKAGSNTLYDPFLSELFVTMIKRREAY